MSQAAAQQQEAPAEITEDKKSDKPSGDINLLSEDGLDEEISDLKIVEGEKPEGLDEKFWDPETKQIKSNDLYKAMQDAEKRAKGLRDKLAKGEGKAPKEAKEYDFKVADEIMAKIPADDPLMLQAKDAALAAGLPKEAFSKFMETFIPKMAELQAQALEGAPAEPTPEEQAEYRKQEYAKIGENAPAVVRAVNAWSKELLSQGVMSETDVKAFQSMAFTGENVRVLNILRTLAGGGKDIPMQASTDTLPSDKEIADMMVAANKSGDSAELRKIDELLTERAKVGRPIRLQI